MSSKNNASLPDDSTPTTLLKQEHPRSLRSHLMRWYGLLIVVALGLFAAMLLWLTTQEIYHNVDLAIERETQIASHDIRSRLQSRPPYWPPTLTLPTIAVYTDPGIAIEVLDLQGRLLYRSSGDEPGIPSDSQALTVTRLTQQPQWYIATVKGERAKVKVVPINASEAGPLIGTLLVAKSLTEVDRTVLLLHLFALLAGVVTLIIALLGSWTITTTVLRPLAEIVKTARTITSTAQGIHVGPLNQRVERPQGDDEMVQVVDTFNEMLASLERASQAQRRFIADASHEFRAPLTTIQGNLSILQRRFEHLPPEERRTMLSDAYGETLRLSRLVDEMLLLAHADVQAAAEKELSRSGSQEGIVELDHALLQLVRQLRGRLGLEGSRLKLEIGHIEPLRVRGEEENLRRVMVILLDNAIKYTTGGNQEQPGRVTVSLERVGNTAIFHVQDTGIGIDAADLPHIFERFYRADRARNRQGAGLGLSIAQMLVEQLGGRITARSAPGQGSTFSVQLPLAE
jgi:two-component system OmpR family sensor kinase